MPIKPEEAEEPEPSPEEREGAEAPQEPPRPADDAEDDRWCMAVRLLGRVERELDETLSRGHGLPLSEYRALCALSRADAEAGSEGGGVGEQATALRMGELADRIGLKDSSVTRLVARLEGRGLAERAAARGDGRAVAARITPLGRQWYADTTPTYRAALGRALEASLGNVYLADLAAWVRTGQSAVAGARPARHSATAESAASPAPATAESAAPTAAESAAPESAATAPESANSAAGEDRP
ncbi:MarR family winged helix-turn-helix transcriptional regulator [Streptomyces sp. CA-250714]|uniref:MarR family winged helix-turn-helix transcriptional regulator n=1 Tax=Streptomyces sp. CA-250714 TaxID=3240060 RepID=UPI003D8A2337